MDKSNVAATSLKKLSKKILDWYEKFSALNAAEAERIITANKFADENISRASANVRDLLRFYQVSR